MCFIVNHHKIKNRMELYYEKLSQYVANGFKIINKWDDHSGTPKQDGANYAIIELPNGSQIKIIYMYEDCIWMPE